MNSKPFKSTNLIEPIQTDTWCQRQSRLVHFSHSWTIENFTYCFDNDPGSRPLIWSSIISASPREKYKFYLKMYPKGQNDECRDFVSLFLNLCITGTLIVDYKFAIVDQDGNHCHLQGLVVFVHIFFQKTQFCKFLTVALKEINTFQSFLEDRREFHYYTTNAKTNRDTLGFDKFIQRDFLLNPENGLLIDNKLTVYCEVNEII